MVSSRHCSSKTDQLPETAVWRKPSRDPSGARYTQTGHAECVLGRRMRRSRRERSAAHRGDRRRGVGPRRGHGVPGEGRVHRVHGGERPRGPGAGREEEPRPDRARPHAPRRQRRGDLRGGAQPVGRADRHADGQGRRGGAHRRARRRGRRLPGQAVQPARAGRARARRAPPHRRRRDAPRGDPPVRRGAPRDRHHEGTPCSATGGPWT